MAIIWTKKTADTEYQVRTAGHSVRLYSNGVLHSQFNRLHPVTGSVWDLLMLPAMVFPKQQPLRVLLLGVGGGTVIRQLQHFREIELLVGVDVDAIHLSVARRFFKVNSPSVELIHADAKKILKSYSGKKFDLVIDDIFGHLSADVSRDVMVDKNWVALLNKVITKKGGLVVNYATEIERRQSALNKKTFAKLLFQSAVKMETPLCENNVVFYSRDKCKTNYFNRIIDAEPELDRSKKTCRLRCSIQKLW